jgi:hypothetical protein
MFKFRQQLGVYITFAYSHESVGIILCCFYEYEAWSFTLTETKNN